MVATVEDGRITKLRPDPDHPLSRGYACPKGIAMPEVQNDPDRVTHPLRRTRDRRVRARVLGGRARATSAPACGRCSTRAGPARSAWYFGNPGAFSYSHTLWVKGFLDAIGSPHYYSAGSQDVNNRFAASALLYGSPLIVPIPDLRAPSFLLMLGANPLVSHGSVLSAPRDRASSCSDRVERRRGGRPAPHRDGAPLRAPARAPRHDAWLLLSLLARDLRGGARRPRVLAAHRPRARAPWSAPARGHPPEATEARTGVPADRVARARARLRRRRVGRRLRAHRLLPRPLRHARRVPARRAQRDHRQPRPPRRRGVRPPAGRARRRRRAGRPRHLRQGALARRRLPGRDRQPARLAARRARSRRPASCQIRALFVSAGNPVLSVPDGEALERALGELDLLRVARPLRQRDQPPRRLRAARHDAATSATTCRSRSSASSPSRSSSPPSGRAAARRGAPGVGDHRRDRPPHRRGALQRAGAAPAGASSASGSARSGSSTCCCAPGRAATCSACAAAGSACASCARHPHGLVLGEHIATGVLAGKLRTRPRRGAAVPAARSPAS